MITFYREAIKAIDRGLSPGIRYLIGSIASVNFLIMFIIALGMEKPLGVVYFALFSVMIALLCFTEGKTRNVIGRLISLVVVMLAVWYLYSAITYDETAENAGTEPSTIKAFLFFFIIGLPALSFLMTGSFQTGKKAEQK